MECRTLCCLCKIRDRVENEVKEFGQSYTILKKRNEEMRQNIRKMKNVCEQYLPKNEK